MPDSDSPNKNKTNKSGKENNSKTTGNSDEDDWKKSSLDSQVGSEIFHPPKGPFHLMEEGHKESSEKKDDKKQQSKDSKKVKSNKSADIDLRSSLKLKSKVVVEAVKGVSPSKPKSPDDSPKATNQTLVINSKGQSKKDSKCANNKKNKHSKSAQRGSSPSPSPVSSLKKHSSAKTPFYSDESKGNKYLVSHPYGHQSTSSDSVFGSEDPFTTGTSSGQSCKANQGKSSAASFISDDSKSQDGKSHVISTENNAPSGRGIKPKTCEKVSKVFKRASITSSEKQSKKQKSKIVSKQVKSADVIAMAPEKDGKKSKSPLPSDNLKKVSSDAVVATKKSKDVDYIMAALGLPNSPKKTVNKGTTSQSSSSGMFYNFSKLI